MENHAARGRTAPNTLGPCRAVVLRPFDRDAQGFVHHQHLRSVGIGARRAGYTIGQEPGYWYCARQSRVGESGAASFTQSAEGEGD